MTSSSSVAQQSCPTCRRYRLVLIDESHNLRNREGRRYRAIQEYISKNESRCILLSATPYNKTYLDLSSQLRLFVAGGQAIWASGRALLREIGETEFVAAPPVRPALAGRVREERVRRRLARADAPLPGPAHAQLHPGELRRDRRRDGRTYLTLADGSRSYFPVRVPRDGEVHVDDSDPNDQYAPLYRPMWWIAINGLRPAALRPGQLPPRPNKPPTPAEQRLMDGPRARGQAADGLLPHQPLQAPGKRRPGLHSVDRPAHPAQLRLPLCHREGLPLPIGTQDAEHCWKRAGRGRRRRVVTSTEVAADGDRRPMRRPAMTPRSAARTDEGSSPPRGGSLQAYRSRSYKNRFKWLPSGTSSSASCARTCARRAGACWRRCVAAATGGPTPTPSSMRSSRS